MDHKAAFGEKKKFGQFVQYWSGMHCDAHRLKWPLTNCIPPCSPILLMLTYRVFRTFERCLTWLTQIQGQSGSRTLNRSRLKCGSNFSSYFRIRTWAGRRQQSMNTRNTPWLMTHNCLRQISTRPQLFALRTYVWASRRTLNGYRPYRQKATWILQDVRGHLHGDLCSLPVPERPESLTLALLAFAMTCSVSCFQMESGKLEPIHWEALMGCMVGGFQLVHWYKFQKYYQYSRNCDLLAVIEPLRTLRSLQAEGSLLVMSANNDDRDSMRKWEIAQDELVAFNSVASSAGSTATMAVLVQSATGHLNGWPSYPFDQEECYARATVAATRSQSLTVIVSPLDMMGIMGMIQVLAARAHPIQEVFQTTSSWTMPELREGETQLEQSDKEIASWRLNYAGHWQEQIEPPLAIFYMETKIGGKSDDMKPVRLRLILVDAAEVRGAESWLGPLKTFRDSKQTYAWLPRQNTEGLMLWAYAVDGDSRPFLWLGPKSTEDAQTVVLRHWLLNKTVPTFPLPGIYFFDAWRIRPVLVVPIQLSAGLTAVDLRHDEEMPPKPEVQDTRRVDRMIRRQEVLTAQSDAKTVADCAMEVSYVMQLSQALLEAGDIIEESTTARHKYLDVQREHEETLEQQGGGKRRATGTTRTSAPAPAVLSTCHNVTWGVARNSATCCRQHYWEPTAPPWLMAIDSIWSHAPQVSQLLRHLAKIPAPEWVSAQFHARHSQCYHRCPCSGAYWAPGAILGGMDHYGLGACQSHYKSSSTGLPFLT